MENFNFEDIAKKILMLWKRLRAVGRVLGARVGWSEWQPSGSNHLATPNTPYSRRCLTKPAIESLDKQFVINNRRPIYCYLLCRCVASRRLSFNMILMSQSGPSWLKFTWRTLFGRVTIVSRYFKNALPKIIIPYNIKPFYKMSKNCKKFVTLKRDNSTLKLL